MLQDKSIRGKNMSNTQIITEKLEKVHNGTVSIVENTFINTHQKAIFIDSEFGPWEANVAGVCRGQRHPNRARDAIRKKSLETIKRILREKFNNKISIDESTFVSQNRKCRFIDCDFGEWYAQPSNVRNGCGHPKRSRISAQSKTTYTVNEINKLIKEKHSENVILISPYKGMLEVHKFRDKDFGNFYALMANVIHKGTGHIKRAVKRRKETSMYNYGVDHPMKTKEIYTKCMRNNTNNKIILHWKTNEELVCTASYEIAVVNWLNHNKIDFLWQHKTFELPNGRHYRPDLFLVSENKWVEIKGYFRDNSKVKWDWFQMEYPNSELWDKIKLKELKII